MISYKNEDLYKLHILQIHILNVFKEICRKYDLKYWVDGGTALGAVRHKGFIPWDDDVDVSMPREDYEKFKKVSRKILSSNEMFLQDYTTEPKIPFNYMKIRLDNTIFVEYCNRNVDMHKGIYIDIFPYDKLPQNDNERHKLFLKARLYEAFWVLRQTPDRSHPPINIKDKIMAIIRHLVHYLSKIIPISIIQNRLINLMIKYKDLNEFYFGYVCSPRLEHTNWIYDDFFPTKEMDFENIKVAVPSNIHIFLLRFFGNYMELPPVDKRVGHQPYIFDLGKYKNINIDFLINDKEKQ